ncbi:MAG: hypothetical protein LBV74_00245 [Tannerella sp.]|jgi:hypothetical protein|nr:hypothetical protein [Tannerella sp.]
MNDGKAEDTVDTSIENKIINSFFLNNRKDRILLDLTRKNGQDVIHKLSQYFSAYIDSRCIVFQSNKGRTISEILGIMQKHGVEKQCYVLSEYLEYNRKQVEINDALEAHRSNGFASIIVGLPSGFTYFQGESYASNKPNCFLKPSVRFDSLSWNKSSIQ